MNFDSLLEKLKAVAKHTIADKEKHGWYYSYFEDFVASEGTVFKSQSLSEEEKEHVLETLKNSKSKKKGECFYNAQLLAIYDKMKKIEYWEGYTNHGGIAILHGFNVINGKIVDVTHKVNGRPILGVFDEGKEYIGVQFDIQLAIDRLKNGKDSTSFIDNWREDWPVLKEKWVKL